MLRLNESSRQCFLLCKVARYNSEKLRRQRPSVCLFAAKLSALVERHFQFYYNFLSVSAGRIIQSICLQGEPSFLFPLQKTVVYLQAAEKLIWNLSSLTVANIVAKKSSSSQGGRFLGCVRLVH